MAFERWKRILRAHHDPWSTLKLSTAAAIISRPWMAPVGRRLLERLSDRGVFWARFRTGGGELAASFRLEQLSSDLLSFYEVGIGDCYRVPPRFQPRTVVDGGGNTGLFTLSALTRWPDCRAIVLEPFPDNAERIRLHLRENGLSAEVRECALDAQPGRATFYLREANRCSLTGEDAFDRTIEVDKARLSEIVDSADGPCLIKLDIEGAELDVLADLLERERPGCFVVGELHHVERSRARFDRLLAERGWRTRELESDGHCALFHAWPAAPSYPLDWID